MAYDKTKLLNISGGQSTLQSTFEYYSEDDVTVAGYFPKGQEVKAGDKVIKVVIAKTGGLVTGRTESKYYAKADASGILTLVAIS